MLLMTGSMLRLSQICGISTMEKWLAGRQTSSRCLSGADEVSALLHGCPGRRLGQDMSWLESPVNNGVLPWIAKEPSGCANQYRPSIAQNPFNIIA